MKKLNLFLLLIGFLFVFYGLYQSYVAFSVLSLYQELNVASPKYPYLTPLIIIIVGIVIIIVSLFRRKKPSLK